MIVTWKLAAICGIVAGLTAGALGLNALESLGLYFIIFMAVWGFLLLHDQLREDH